MTSEIGRVNREPGRFKQMPVELDVFPMDGGELFEMFDSINHAYFTE